MNEERFKELHPDLLSVVDDRKRSFYLIKNFTNCKLSVGGDQRQVC